jgi:hypothetical protein
VSGFLAGFFLRKMKNLINVHRFPRINQYKNMEKIIKGGEEYETYGDEFEPDIRPTWFQ